MRVESGHYVAGFALVSNDQVERVRSYAAPADRDEPGQLADLARTCADLIDELSPDAIAIRAYEARQEAAKRLSHHAEGVLMAAAGGEGVSVRRFLTQSLWKPAGFAKPAKAEESIDALWTQLASDPPGPAEVDKAAATARALMVSGS